MEFGRYELLGRIGAGATGIVWLAHQRDTGRRVAIKELDPSFGTDADFRRRFREEARTLAAIDDRNIVRVFDYVEEDDGAYIVEELVEGASLAEVIRQAGRLSAAQSVGVLRGALSGLATAHELGIIHGDVKPANILVDAEGTSKLIDFGLSGPSGAPSRSGTVAYASPELLRGESVDVRSDVYAAGCVLFELLAGRPPFTGPTLDSIAAQHLAGAVPPVPEYPRVGTVIASAMAKDRTARPADARALLGLLEEEADHDLGAAWLTASSVAALSTAVVATRAATSPSAAADGTELTTYASAHVKAPRSRLTRGRVAAGGAVVAVVAVVAIVAASAGGGGSGTRKGIGAAAIAAANGASTKATSAKGAGTPLQLIASPGFPLTLAMNGSNDVTSSYKTPPMQAFFTCDANGCILSKGYGGARFIGGTVHSKFASKDANGCPESGAIELRVVRFTQIAGVRVPAAVSGSIDYKVTGTGVCRSYEFGWSGSSPVEEMPKP